MDHPSSVNEVDRLAVRLPDDATIYQSPTYIAIAFDADVSTARPTPKLLQRRPCMLEYQAQYELFSTLCADRAQQTVDAQLLVAGRSITPEKYLALWRHAVANAISLRALFADYGLRIVATLRAPLSAMAGRRSSWTCCPFGTFDAFLARHRPCMKFDAAGSFTLHLDLRDPDAARDAFYGASMLSDAFTAGSPECHVAMVLEHTRRHKAQAPLFASTGLMEA